MATTRDRRRVGPYRVSPPAPREDTRIAIARRYKRHLRGAIVVPEAASLDEDARKVPVKRAEVKEPTSRLMFGRREEDDDGDE